MIPPHTASDRISFRSSLGPLKAPAFAVIGALQDHSGDVQVEALALTLVIMAESLNLDPHELVSRARRQTADGEWQRNEHLEAIRDYALGELK